MNAPLHPVGFEVSVIRTGVWQILALIVGMLMTSNVLALSADGWASQGAGTTGGTGGTIVTVSSAAAYKRNVESTATLIVRVDGMIDVGSNIAVHPRSNKTIVGVGMGSGVIGTHIITSTARNIIFKNLTMRTYDMLPTSDTDAISLRGGKNIWVNHCTVFNCSDGLIDQGLGTDYVTISWCKFYYTQYFGHNLVNLVGSNSAHKATDVGHLNTTFHHNWYGSFCTGRMPMVRFGKVHVYNNYYNSPGCNMYIGLAWMCEVLLQNSYFEDGNQKTGKIWYYYESNAKLKQTGNVFVDVPVNTSGGNDSVFTPPYEYTLDNAANVKDIVTGPNGAGVNGDEGED